MEIQNLSVNIDGKAPSEPIEIIVREGRAAKAFEPVGVKQSGTLQAVGEYINKRPQLDPGDVLVTYSLAKDDYYIQINSDANNPDADIVTGRLTECPELKDFNINQDVFFEAKQLIKLVQRSATCFADIEDAKKLIKNLRNFSASFKQEVSKHDDRQGNTEESIKKALDYSEGAIEKTVALHTPIFIGTEDIHITLEIEIELRGSTPVFGFFSLDYEQQKSIAAKRLIQEEIGKLNTFACLQVK